MFYCWFLIIYVRISYQPITFYYHHFRCGWVIVFVINVFFLSRRGLIGRRKAMVRVPGQTSKRNTKSISTSISSQQISGKNSESKIKLLWKVSHKKKICRSESTLNCRSRHLCITINTHNRSGVRKLCQ